jgi:N-acetylmuramoyl-L-alanine amidase
VKFKVVVLLIVIVLLLTSVIHGDNSDELKLILDGKPLQADQGRAIRLNKRVYISLPFFSSLYAVTRWDAETGNATIRLGTLLIKMTQGKSTATWDGKTKKLSYAPTEQDGGVWIPLEVACGLGLKSDLRGDVLELSWEQNSLLFVKSSSYQGRPAITFQTTKPVQYKNYLLTEPNRLVLDLEGVKRFPYLEEDMTPTPIVQRVRINQFREDTFRMVFDLNQLAGYQILVPEENPNQVLVVFNALIKDIRFESAVGDPRVIIDATAPLAYTMSVMVEPHRLVVDIDDATLATPKEPIKGDGAWVNSVRMSQFNSHTVRVVLDVATPQTCYITKSRLDPKRIEVRTQQEIRRVKWQPDEQGGALLIDSSAELDEEFIHHKDPERLLVNLRFAQLVTDTQEIPVEDSVVKAVRVSQQNTDVQVELSLESYQGYEAIFSKDRCSLAIRMKNSPVARRVIVLDPGHGGVDAGAIGSQGVREKGVNLEVALRLKDLLEEAGAQVVLTRIDDRYVSLYERAAIANQVGAAMFISIHSNFHPNSNVRGVEIFHYPDRVTSNRLGRILLDEMTKATGFSSLAVKTSPNMVVIRETQMTSVLVEMGFLSNYQEEAIIATSEFREKMAKGIFNGILRYWKPENPSKGPRLEKKE